ncbi:MAG: hypothetical protein QOH48_2434 [Actinomycetota bacterium]|nr:hypothetical protein [Actinomycetota bacterium]
MEILIAALVLLVLGFAAPILGADSQDGNDWVSHDAGR